MRRIAVPATLAVIALGLTACSGGENSGPQQDSTESTRASASPSETPSASSSVNATNSSSATPPETPETTGPPVEVPTAAPPAAERTAGAHEEYVSSDNPGGYIEVDAWAENGEPGAWTEYDAQGNPIGAAVGGPPSGSEDSGEFDYETAVQDPESVYYGMTVEEARAVDQNLVDAFGGEDEAYAWADWFGCSVEAEQSVDAEHVPGPDATSEDWDAYYDLDLTERQAQRTMELCGPEPA